VVSRWKVLSAAFVIFAAGAATGGILVRTFVPRIEKRTHVTPPLPMSTQKRMEYVDKLAREVQLTPEQRQKVEGIIAASQERMKIIWDGVAPRVKEEYHCSRREISEILTPEQRDKMKRWHRERFGSKTNGTNGSFLQTSSSNSPAVN
jgi:Spy/CpxP family protein refolding chaperone